MTLEEAREFGIKYIPTDDQQDGITQEILKGPLPKRERRDMIPMAVVERATELKTPENTWDEVIVTVKKEFKGELKYGFKKDNLVKASNKYLHKVSSSMNNIHDCDATEQREEDAKKGSEAYLFHKSIMDQTVYFYEDASGVSMVEVHVDCLPVEFRVRIGTKVTTTHGYTFNMGGCRSIRVDPSHSHSDAPDVSWWEHTYPGEPARAVDQNGFDECCFKQYNDTLKKWMKDKQTKMKHKTDGKGLMKAVFKNEIFGVGYNYFPIELVKLFDAQRDPTTHNFKYAPFVNWEYDTKTVIQNGNIVTGYWTNEHMLELTDFFMDFWHWIWDDATYEDGTLVNLQLVIELDHSTGHSAKDPNGLDVANLKSGWGERFYTKTKEGEHDEGDAKPHPHGPEVDGSYILTAGDLSPNEAYVPVCNGAKLKIGDKQYCDFQPGADPPFFDPNTTEIYIGMPKGGKQLLHEQGLYRQGMTWGESKKGIVVDKPHAFQKHDVVLVRGYENDEDEDDPSQWVGYLYRVVGVPDEHEDVSSEIDKIKLQWLNLDKRNWKPPSSSSCTWASGKYYRPTGQYDTYFASEISSLEKGTDFEQCGVFTDAAMCRVRIKCDVQAIAASMNAVAGDGGGNQAEETKEDSSDDVDEGTATGTQLDSNCMKHVLAQTTAFKMAKSMLQIKVEARGGILIMSVKFAAENAGIGIEYDNGRAKMDYKRNRGDSIKALRNVSVTCWRQENITIHHTRKFARKSRDYTRCYKAGVSGLDKTIEALKAVKTHRCALDTDYGFIAENNDPGTEDISYGDSVWDDLDYWCEWRND